MLERREGGCHCGRVRFRARVDLDLLSQCNCSICTKKGILHLGVSPEDFELLRGKNSLTSDGIDGPSLKPTRFFDGRHWEEAQRKRIADGGHVPAAGLNGSVTLQRILDRAPE
jgi:hypothetical protein